MFQGKIECKCVCSIHHFLLEMVALNLHHWFHTISGFMFYHIFHNFIFFFSRNDKITLEYHSLLISPSIWIKLLTCSRSHLSWSFSPFSSSFPTEGILGSIPVYQVSYYTEDSWSFKGWFRHTCSMQKQKKQKILFRIKRTNWVQVFSEPNFLILRR